jgi:hypothetical protein
MYSTCNEITPSLILHCLLATSVPKEPERLLYGSNRQIYGHVTRSDFVIANLVSKVLLRASRDILVLKGQQLAFSKPDDPKQIWRREVKAAGDSPLALHYMSKAL